MSDELKATPSPSGHLVGPDRLIAAVFNELGEAEYKLARWDPASEPWHYWSREAIDNAIRSVLAAEG